MSGQFQTSSVVVGDKPTISTSAYSSGQVVGGARPITGGIPGQSGSGILQSLGVKEKGTQKAPFTIYLFKSQPTGVGADAATFTMTDADWANLICPPILIAAADYSTVGTGYQIASPATARNLAEVVQELTSDEVRSRNIWYVAVTTGTPTFAAVTALEFFFKFLQD